jgi:hypothetical protein
MAAYENSAIAQVREFIVVNIPKKILKAQTPILSLKFFV